MKAVLQRVAAATVSVDGEVIASIGLDSMDKAKTTLADGLLILLGVQAGDTEKDSAYLAQKAADLRIFADDAGKMNRSIVETGGAALVVSQFTLLADCSGGRRPSFIKAARPEEGRRLYLHFVAELKRYGVPVETGEFGAHMQISLVNDGPVTIILEQRFAG